MEAESAVESDVGSAVAELEGAFVVESVVAMGAQELIRETSNAEEDKAAEAEVVEAAAVGDCIAMERRIASCISRASSGWPNRDSASEKKIS